MVVRKEDGEEELCVKVVEVRWISDRVMTVFLKFLKC